jgi:hypothetical protein
VTARISEVLTLILILLRGLNDNDLSKLGLENVTDHTTKTILPKLKENASITVIDWSLCSKTSRLLVLKSVCIRNPAIFKNRK